MSNPLDLEGMRWAKRVQEISPGFLEWVGSTLALCPGHDSGMVSSRAKEMSITPSALAV